MNRYKISYFYLATGMEGIADSLPEKVISAEDRDKAIYKYWESQRNIFKSYEHFLQESKHIREWGITCTLIGE